MLMWVDIMYSIRHFLLILSQDRQFIGFLIISLFVISNSFQYLYAGGRDSELNIWIVWFFHLQPLFHAAFIHMHIKCVLKGFFTDRCIFW